MSFVVSGTSPFIQTGFAQQSFQDGQSFQDRQPSQDGQLETLRQQEKQARDLYHTQQFSEAISRWQAIAQTHAAHSNPIRQASALSNLALSYHAIGQWANAQTAIAESLDIIMARENEPNAQPVLAQVLMASGSLQIDSGAPEQALESWQQAATIYTHIGNRIGQNRAYINQAQALRELGFYGRSRQQLQAVATELESEPPSQLKAVILRRLGEALRLSGQRLQAEQTLTQGLHTAQEINAPTEISASLLSLGHTARGQADIEAASHYYRQALEAIADNPSDQLTIPIQLAQLALAIDGSDWQTAAELSPRIQATFSRLPLNRTNIYYQINWASSLLKRLQTPTADTDQPSNQPSVENIAQQLQQVIAQAQQLEDTRAEAYGVGILGQVYQQTEQWQEAEQLTQRALALSELSQAPDIMYRWQWQLGKLLSHPNNPARSKNEALASYTEAIETLSQLRGDLAAADAQFSFRDNVEPVYREMVSLLLDTDKQATDYIPNLKRAQNVIESLRVAELDNYFHEACADVQPIDKTEIAPNTALIHTIVLSDRLSLILNLPHQPPQHIEIAVSEADITQIMHQLRQALVIRSRRDYFTVAKQAYDALIAPIRPALDASEVKTIVFVPDGPLQTVPLAALYDGDRFLIEDYAIGLTPSLQLIQPKPWLTEKPVQNQRTLIGGLTEGRAGFSPLPYVENEINSITQTIHRNSILLNQNFTKEALAERLKDNAYPIVHIATHGQFGSTPEETYLLTWNGRINVQEVNEMLQTNLGGRESIELLMLSACETATSDPNAGLGLAGVAVKAGAKSTLGTLWAINDESTAHFVDIFYQQLTQPNVTRAEALRQTQITLLKDPQYQHPIYWSAYILLGSWL
ncbi:MAG: CHAT domain-containing protein [Phormidesmis sp.]